MGFTRSFRHEWSEPLGVLEEGSRDVRARWAALRFARCVLRCCVRCCAVLCCCRWGCWGCWRWAAFMLQHPHSPLKRALLIVYDDDLRPPLPPPVASASSARQRCGPPSLAQHTPNNASTRLDSAHIQQASSAKFFVGGNWKCNGTHASVEKLVADLNAGGEQREQKRKGREGRERARETERQTDSREDDVGRERQPGWKRSRRRRGRRGT